jgi:hypothetical protein
VSDDLYPPQTLEAALARLAGAERAVRQVLDELRQRDAVILAYADAQAAWGHAANRFVAGTISTEEYMQVRQRQIAAKAAYGELVAFLRQARQASEEVTL